MMKGIGKLVLYILMSVSFATIASLASSHVNVSINKRDIQVGESFTVIFSTNKRSVGQPDFSPLLQHFTQLYVKSGSRSLSYGNPGTLKTSYSWRLILRAVKPGKFDIPAIKFGSVKSPPITITIKGSTSKNSKSGTGTTDKSQSIFVRATLEPGTLYPKQEGLVKIKVYVNRELSARVSGVSQPGFDVGDAIVKKLNNPTAYTEIINKIPYYVHERQYVIYPQKPGPLKLKPFSIVVNIRHNNNRSFNDPFFNDPSFPAWYPRWRSSPRWQRLTRQTNALTVEVKPIPAKISMQQWLPARQVEVKEVWNKSGDIIRVGDAISRVITLSADGQIPELIPPIKYHKVDDIKVYQGNPTMNNFINKSGMVGKRIEKHALIATKAGELVLPEISMLWWNTNTSRFENAIIPERKITVLPAMGGTNMVNPGSSLPSAIARPNSANGVRDNAENISSSEAVSAAWPWISGFVFMLWLGTIGLWWYSARTRDGHSESMRQALVADTPRSESGLLSRIKTACLNNQASECRNYLLKWGRHHFGDSQVASLSQLVDILGNQALGQAIQALDRSLYSRAGLDADWQGEQLWQEFSQLELNSGNREQSKTKAGLAPINPG